jgi:amino acid adenylation domain-containing protein
LIVALLAILKAGACYVPLDPAYPAGRLGIMARESGASPILTTRALAASLPSFSDPIFLDESPAAGESSENLPLDVPVTSPAYVMFTSGSTGRPKGVAIPHRAIVRLVRGQDYVSLGPDETFLQFAPVSFDASTLEIWGPLLNGGRLALAPPGALSLDQIAEAIRSLGVTSIWLTSGLFNLMADERPDAFAPLRQLLAGGDVLSIPHVRKVMAAHPHLRLINGYGPTESTTFACCHTIIPADLDLPSIPIGKPIANTTVRILDEQNAPVPIGVPGELFIGGDGLALGYWNQPALTAEKFLLVDGRRFYRTGDRVRWLPSGVIQFLGRRDHQVKVRGYRIELGEIEAALANQPGVLRCTVVALGDGADKQLAAYHTGPAEPAALREALRRQLPDHMVPAFFVRLDSLPLTGNGKVDRSLLPAPVASEPLPADLPGTDIEKTLAGLWSEVLAIPAPGLRANFFDVGGTSLRLVEVHSRLVRVLRRQIPVTALFQYPTIASLAAHLGEDAPAGNSRLAAAAERARAQREVLARKLHSQKVP